MVGQLVASASLARFTVSAAKLAGRSGQGSRVLQAAAVAGGGLAAATVAPSALAIAALTDGPGMRDSRASSLHRFAYLAGGPAHGFGLGLLVGSLSPAGPRSGELPRPLAIAGLASAAAGVLSPASLVAEPAVAVLPLGWFSTLLVSGIARAWLARRPR